ncbi:MAG: Rid family detoxifying hydrolase, partial [Bacteroidota bacterium]
VSLGYGLGWTIDGGPVMNKTVVMFLMIALVGCGKSEDETRSIVRDELSKATERLYVTDAQVIGPYSPAVQVGNLLFVSGQIGLNPATSALAGEDIESQTRQSLENLMAILKKTGYDSSHVVQCTVFLKDINDFQKMNLIYGGYFEEGKYPTRTTVEVSNLPRKAKVEIAAIAYR